ncbi:MAG: hypothetical protein A2086_10155 [Spirochaetes bacterium GWD1_27_9]|nr:MAG: hypothetical protein A2Z98_08050 [Spirochaetes bacterium GWB1_27_13]OHD35792.1 MAG: hypothetical protein A2086_10155 [Spirochaetes bacterium GWD1_27_9]
MAEPFIGQILAVAFNYAPQGWADCNGALIPVQQSQALFALLGVTFGGDGRNNFGLPDLRSRSIIGYGQGKDNSGNPLNNYTWGQKGGYEKNTITAIMGNLSTLPLTGSATLTPTNLPNHTHDADISTLKPTGTVSIGCSSATANQTTGDQGYLANANTVINRVSNPTNAYNTSTPDKTLKSDAASFTGSGMTGSVNVSGGGGNPQTPVAVSVPVNNVNSGLAITSITVNQYTSTYLSNIQPYLALRYIIAIEGFFPSRPS